MTTIDRITLALASLPDSAQAQHTAAIFLQAFRLATGWLLDVYRDYSSPELRGKLEELRVALAQSLECLSSTLLTLEDVNEEVLFPYAVPYLDPVSPQAAADLKRLRDLLRGDVESLRAEIVALGGSPTVVEGGAS